MTPSSSADPRWPRVERPGVGRLICAVCDTHLLVRRLGHVPYPLTDATAAVDQKEAPDGCQAQEDEADEGRPTAPGRPARAVPGAHERSDSGRARRSRPRPGRTARPPVRLPAQLIAVEPSCLGSAPYRYQARILMHAPLNVVADRASPTAGRLEAVDEHTCILHTGSNSLEQLALYVGLKGVDFEVLDPPELRQHVRALGQRFTRAAAGNN